MSHVGRHTPRNLRDDFIRGAIRHGPAIARGLHSLYSHSTRKRVRDNVESSDAHNTDRLRSPVHNIVTSRTHNAPNGNKHVTIKCAAKGHFSRGGGIGSSDIARMMFPKLKIKSLQNGALGYVDPASVTYALFNYIGQTGATGAGSALNLNCAQNSVGIFEFIHLSRNSLVTLDDTPNSGLTAQLACTGESLRSLWEKAQNVMTSSVVAYQNKSDGPSTNLFLNTTAGTAAQQALTSQYGAMQMMQMYYGGGYTKHTFYNPTNVDIHFEVMECRPKYYVPGVSPLILNWADRYSSNSIQQVTVASNVMTANTYVATPPVTTSREYPLCTKNSDNVHASYLVSNKKNVILLPGEDLTVIVSHPAFKISGDKILGTRAAWDDLGIISNSAEGRDQVPACCVWLVVKMVGQEIAIKDATSVPSRSTTAAGILLHQQEEVHNVRCCPSSRENVEICLSNLYNPTKQTGETYSIENELLQQTATLEYGS